MQLLLDKGADVNAQGGLYGNALYAASINGNLKVMQLLLDEGANINAQDGYYGNALQAASTYKDQGNIQGQRWCTVQRRRLPTKSQAKYVLIQ
jgi:ankyrin repeat protein